MAKKSEIIVKDVSIRTMKVNGTDYLCITDIAKQKNNAEPKDVVKNWMRQKNTLEYLGLWERLHNPTFKGVEFDPLLAEAGSNLIPAEVTKAQTSIIYAEEADVLNVAMFGMTAKQWREANPELKGNIRDYATINELICLSNMENVERSSISMLFSSTTACPRVSDW